MRELHDTNRRPATSTISKITDPSAGFTPNDVIHIHMVLASLRVTGTRHNFAMTVCWGTP
ncbi:hypothetical protein BDZ89DRAFT_1062943 [Hymenopellis radicata]|nr:hypothetical protein BDZ89DRAFT_1062943 [Hymenopellis radicata]